MDLVTAELDSKQVVGFKQRFGRSNCRELSLGREVRVASFGEEAEFQRRNESGLQLREMMRAAIAADTLRREGALVCPAAGLSLDSALVQGLNV